jgi:hypothetical protein
LDDSQGVGKLGMTATFDLNLLPIARYGGRDYPEMVGVYFSEPPRRAARGRSQDRLVLYLAFEGNSPLTPDARDQALAHLAQLYYRTTGSVTAALRKTAEELNSLLLERNRQLGSNRQCVGLLTQAVLRAERIFIAQSGQTHIYLIAGDGLHHIYDPELAGRGLGLVRASTVSFSQVDFKVNDVLLLAAQPSQAWSPTALASVHSQGPESLRRRLFSQTTDDLNAVALQAKQGKGKFILLRQPAPGAAPAPAAPAAPAPAASAPAAPMPKAEPVTPPFLETAVPVAEDQIPQVEAGQVGDVAAAEAQLEAEPAEIEAAVVAAEVEPALDGGGDSPPVAADVPKAAAPQIARVLGLPGEAAPQASPDRTRRPSSIRTALAGIGASIRQGSSRVLGGMRTFLGRALPDESFLNIPSGAMAMIAIAVPVVIVTAASMVYFRLGRAVQYDLLSTQARQMALQAMEQNDQAARRADLGAALAQLQKAEVYASTLEEEALIQDLRVQVRNALDELDYVRRVNYQPAIVGGLPVTSNIVGIAAFDDELFLLDGASGSVLRAVLTGQGYQLDYTFQCQPGKYSEIVVGPLVEVIAWPAGYSPPAKVIASDTSGNVLYCRPDEPPVAERLTPPETDNWGNIPQAALDQGDYYALDLPSNGVWIYWRSNFGEPPAMFFDKGIPPLQDARDMLVDRDDLYLLQMDGSMIMCARDSLIVAPTNCASQAYIDRRPGRENLPLAPSSPFIQIISTPPPDPSLYLLEPLEHAVYHFSLRSLAFQRQYLPETPLPARQASAFAINSSRRYLYTALGNQIFYAAMP